MVATEVAPVGAPDPLEPPTSPGTSPLRGSFEERRANARDAFIAVALIAIGAVSAIQVIGYTSTMLTPVCALLAPALFLSRPTAGQWIPLALAGIGFAGFVISFMINDFSIIDQRVVQWLAFAIYYIGFLVLAERNLERAFALLCGVAIGAVLYAFTPGNAYSMYYRFADLWKYAWGQWVVIILVYL